MMGGGVESFSWSSPLTSTVHFCLCQTNYELFLLIGGVRDMPLGL